MGDIDKINSKLAYPLKEDEVFTFDCKAIGNAKVGNRLMKIGDSEFEKMAEQANDGIPLLLNHSWSKIGGNGQAYGRSYDAEVINGEGGEETKALNVKYYLQKGLNLGGEKTDDIINAIKGGTYRDVSIGFQYNSVRCSICGKEYGECGHRIGKTYDTKKGKEVCVYELSDVELFEVSLVYAPAYKGARITGFNKDATMNYADYCIPKKGCCAFSRNGLELIQSLEDGEEETMNFKKKTEEVKDESLEVEKVEEKAEEVKGIAETAETVEKVEETTETAKETEATEEITKKQAEAPEETIYYELGDNKFTIDEVLAYAKDGLEVRSKIIQTLNECAVRANPNIDLKAFGLACKTYSLDELTKQIDAFNLLAEKEIPAGRKTEVASVETFAKIDDERFKI